MAQPTQGFDPRGLLASGSRVIVVVSSGPPATQAPLVEMPSLLGEKQGDALTVLQDAGLSAKVFNDYSDSYKRGDVMGQLPPATAGIPYSAEAVMLVSSGPAVSHTKSEPLPDVVGKSEAEAVSLLQAASFSPQVVREPSTSVLAGTVIAQLPNRATLAAVPPKKSNWWVWVLTAVVLAVLAAAAFFFFRPTGDTVAVPDVVGQPIAEATVALQDAGLTAAVTEVEGDGEPGTVTKTDPEAGTEVDKGSEVKVEVVKGAEQIAVPDVKGLDQAAATKRLQSAGLQVTSKREESSFVAQGLVISQNPAAGQKVDAGSSVEIVVSSGQAQQNVKVPDVVGLSQSEAESTLEALGLKVVDGDSSSSSVAKGNVISQLPSAGDSVAPGTTVGITVSSGPATPDTVNVPDVVGLDIAAAETAITDAGLVAQTVAASGSGKPANEVFAQTPGGGTKAEKGSTVVLFYSTGP